MKRKLVLMAFAAVLLVGCDSGQMARMREALSSARQTAATFDGAVDQLKQKKAEVDAAIADMPDGPEKTEAKAVSEELAQWIARYDRGRLLAMEKITELEAKLATAQDEIDAFEAVGTTAAPYAGVYAPLVALAVGFAASVWRAVKNGKAAKAGADVIRAVETAKVNGVVNFADPATVKVLSAVMSEGGKALVDKVQGK